LDLSEIATEQPVKKISLPPGTMLVTLLLVCCTTIAQTAPATTPSPGPAQGYQTIHNDFFWVDQNGNRIQTRSGCLRQFNSRFYWYGGTNRFHDQTCYTSTDLVHWTYLGVALHRDLDADRMDVLYNDATKTYVMFLKYFTDGAFFAIATSPTPQGPYTFRSQTLLDNAKMGDMSLFEDTDGKAYLSYVSWATGINMQHGIYLLSPDYLKLDKRIYLWDIPHREAPHIFKRNGIYYYGTSKTAGIRSSGTSYYTATSLSGPWSPAKPLNTPGSINSWDSQVDFVYQFEGTKGTVYMFAGDRWIKNGGRQGDYVWLPMQFDGDIPTVNYYQDWDLDLSAGTWRKFDPSRDLASGKAATASSVNGTNVAGNVTALTTYENYTGKRWESEPSEPQWIMVDLGAPEKINRVIHNLQNHFRKIRAHVRHRAGDSTAHAASSPGSDTEHHTEHRPEPATQFYAKQPEQRVFSV
jgi:hypothetical protein